MSRGKAVQDGVRVKLAAGTTWEKLAGMTPDEIKAQTVGRKASTRCRTRITRRAAWSSEAAHRRGEETDRARSDALRSRLRSPRSSDPGNPGGHLPRDAARPGRRLERGARDARQLRAALQRGPQPETARRPAAAPHPVSAAAVQPDRGSAQAQASVADCHAKAQRLGHAYRRRHPAQRAPSSIRRRCAASASSACSDRSAP